MDSRTAIRNLIYKILLMTWGGVIAQRINLLVACVFNYPKPHQRKNSQRTQKANNELTLWIHAWRAAFLFPEARGGKVARWLGDPNSGEVGCLGRPCVLEMGGRRKGSSIVRCRERSVDSELLVLVITQRATVQQPCVSGERIKEMGWLGGDEKGEACYPGQGRTW